jgi:hypothetical protein
MTTLEEFENMTKSPISKLRNFYTVYRGQNDKPIIQEWIGFRNGNDAYLGKDTGWRGRNKRVLRCHPGDAVFDTNAAAIASLKPVMGFCLKWRNEVEPALVFKNGAGKWRAIDKNGRSLGVGFLTKRQVARIALKEAVRWEKQKAREYRESQLTVARLRKIMKPA